jgi:hypothetical protein
VLDYFENPTISPSPRHCHFRLRELNLFETLPLPHGIAPGWPWIINRSYAGCSVSKEFGTILTVVYDRTAATFLRDHRLRHVD